MKPGDLVTPTGVLVMSADEMHADHTRWLELRRKRDKVGYCIGGSDVPSILDCDGADTPAHVWRDKVWNIGREPNEAMRWGKRLEAPIAEDWAERNRVDQIDEIGLVAHKDLPWLQVTIDRRVWQCPVYKDKLTEGTCGLEVKNVGFASASRWHRDIPDRILAQVIVEMFVTGFEHMHYTCLVGGNALKQGILYADRERELTAHIIGEVTRFRDEYLVPEREPAWDLTHKEGRYVELDKATHPDRIGTLALGPDGLDDVLAYVETARASSLAKKRQTAAKARLLQLADGHEFVTFGDEPAYWFNTAERTDVNLDKLKERYPDAYDDPEVVTHKTHRVLNVARRYREEAS